MLRVIGLLVIGVVMVIRPSDALTCFPCDEDRCAAAPECNYGVGTGECGCCPECLKGPGERCGGPWDITGTCSEDHICEKKNKSRFDFNAVGVCVPTTPPKGPGERCGGPLGISGACRKDHICQKKIDDIFDVNADGVCVLATGDNVFRKKRGLASPSKDGRQCCRKYYEKWLPLI